MSHELIKQLVDALRSDRHAFDDLNDTGRDVINYFDADMGNHIRNTTIARMDAIAEALAAADAWSKAQDAEPDKVAKAAVCSLNLLPRVCLAPRGTIQDLRTQCCNATMSVTVDLQAMAGKTVPFYCDDCGKPARARSAIIADKEPSK